MKKLFKTFKNIKPVNVLLLIIITTFLFSKQISAQINRIEIIGAYTFNFAKHTKIIHCDNKELYNISLFTENQELIKEFKKIEASRKINNKKVSLNIYKNSSDNYSNACLIFIAADKSEYYSEIFNKTKDSGILIVSENYINKREIMLNLYDTDDGKILFEINRGNIYNRDIEISDELLLMGGTEIDVAKLYLESQKKLNRTEERLNRLQSNLTLLTSKIKDTQIKVKLQQDKINEQIKLIDSQKKEEYNLLSEIKIHKNEVLKQQKLFNNEKKKLILLNDSLNNSKTLLEIQKKELNDDMHTLKVLKDEIRIKTREIKVQEITLGEQYDVIYKQKKINQLFIIITILGLAVAAILIINGIQRKKKNKLLKEQKTEIFEKNEELENQFEEISSINERLNEKNEELSQLLETLKKAQHQLIQSEKMASLGVLTAGIAHEINNPINFVYTGINSLQKDFKDIEVIINKIKDLNPNDKNLKEKIQAIQTLKKELYFDDAVEAIPQTIIDISIGANRTAEIVNGLRKFSRMDENKFILSDIHEYIQTALLILKNKYKDVINIERNYDKNIPQINCNPGKITQVFMNIIYNSIDAINEKKDIKGKIIITTVYKNEKVKISIKDNGKGIKEDVKKKMFDPFFTTKDVGKGTGLGLAISYGIIEEHKGEIKVLSEINKGTEFIIILPAKH